MDDNGKLDGAGTKVERWEHVDRYTHVWTTVEDIRVFVRFRDDARPGEDGGLVSRTEGKT